jgi:hypothetical protein
VAASPTLCASVNLKIRRRQHRHLAATGWIADRARHTRAPAIVVVHGLARMLLADPARVLASRAVHRHAPMAVDERAPHQGNLTAVIWRKPKGGALEATTARHTARGHPDGVLTATPLLLMTPFCFRRVVGVAPARPVPLTAALGRFSRRAQRPLPR